MMIMQDEKQRAIETVMEILKGNWPLAEAIVRKLSDNGLMAQAERDRICAMLRSPSEKLIGSVADAIFECPPSTTWEAEGRAAIKEVLSFIETGASHDAG